MKIWPVILASLCFITLVVPAHSAPDSVESQDSIGRKRLTDAYVYVVNAEALVKGGSVTPKPKLEKKAAGLSTRELRQQIGLRADTVEKAFSQTPTGAQELAVTTRVRAARVTLTTLRDVKLEDIHKFELERRKNPKNDSPASFLRKNVEAIHQALAAK